MNEKIEELAIKSGAYRGVDSVVIATMDIEKFAKLIIEESIIDFYRRYLDTTSNEDITVQMVIILIILKNISGLNKAMSETPKKITISEEDLMRTNEKIKKLELLGVPEEELKKYFYECLMAYGEKHD